MNEPRPLLHLYQLLLEQIKDEPHCYSLLTEVTSYLEIAKVISREEENLIDEDIIAKYDVSECQKAFVQRMIKQLENDK